MGDRCHVTVFRVPLGDRFKFELLDFNLLSVGGRMKRQVQSPPKIRFPSIHTKTFASPNTPGGKSRALFNEHNVAFALMEIRKSDTSTTHSD